MRLTDQDRVTVKRLVEELFGSEASVVVFGSRVDDAARGGDLDLLITTSKEVPHPAVSAAKLSSRVSRAMNGREVDVLIKSPSLKTLPVHRVALQTGQRI
ncbi:nucleotidyltransferase domain-containing protein [Marinimicrobium sp. C2-29]|uniref:nucleotidyltransferase domain-containing protein n=1 Tax=Marinimicrobium sp. C2-29 TaxID=3139825 RepID=UPI003139BFCA